MGPYAQGAEALIGQSVAGYRLERVLGVGATGAVYLGTRLPDAPQLLERPSGPAIEYPAQAALKLLYVPWQLNAEESADFRARFVREADTLRQLDSPHILPILDSGEDVATGLLFMLLPYYPETLAAHLAASGGRLPLDACAAILAQLAEALDYAHGRGVVHRDIKPANILLDANGTVFLADFGILHLLDPSRTKLTATGQVMGTPEYMAPEQANGEEVGPAADRYSLAIVLYQMVTGQAPFTGASPVQVAMRQVQDMPTPPSQLRPGLPAATDAVLLKALAKRPGDRFGFSTLLAQAFALSLTGQLPAGMLAQSTSSAPSAPSPPVTLPMPPYAAPPAASFANAATLRPTPFPSALPVAPTVASRPHRPGLAALLSVGLTLLVIAGLLLAVTQNAFGLRDVFASHGVPGFASNSPTSTKSGVSPSPTTIVVNDTLGMSATSFDIQSLTIYAGGIVHFDDTVNGGGTHDICLGTNQQCDTSAQGPAELRSPGFIVSPGQSRQVLFPIAGTYPITCTLHPQMNATITVVNPSGASTATPLSATRTPSPTATATSASGAPTNTPVPSSPYTVFFGSYDGTLYALDAVYGTLRWRFTTGSSIFSSPAVDSGLVIFGSWDDNVYALHAGTGKLAWKTSTGGAVYSSPAVSGGIVFIGSWDHNMYALRESDGSVLWHYQTGDVITSSPVVSNGLVYFGSDDNYIYALNASDGSLAWKYTTGAHVYSVPTVVNGIVYVGSRDDYVYALNASSGSLVWRFQTGAQVWANPIVVGGAVYIGSDDGNVYALNAGNGQVIWQHQFGGGFSPARFDNGVVYVGGTNHTLYALNASDGSVLWTYEAGAAVVAQPAAFNGELYAGSDDSYLYALGEADGSLRWKYQTSGIVHSSPVVASV